MNLVLLVSGVSFAILAGSLDVLAAPAVLSRSNLDIGAAIAGDRLLFSEYLEQPAQPNTIQYDDVIFRGNETTKITAIHATEVGDTQYAQAWVTGGGVGANSVTIRVQSARGQGYHYLIEIWGR